MKDEVVSTNPDVIGDFWAKEVYPYLKPIVEADYRQEPSPIGSAVLVGFRSKQYLATAGHVIAPHLGIRAPAGTPKGAPYCFLPEQVEIRGPIDIADDPFDLALIEVPAASRPCLSLPQHLALDVRDGELCLFVGFQARERSWATDSQRHTIRPRPLSYLGAIRKASPTRFSIRFSDKHLHRSGVKQNAAGKLNGISGAGVYVLRKDSPKLAGIVIEYHSRQSEIVITSAVALWEMMRQKSLQGTQS
jgi:hypothetical protein